MKTTASLYRGHRFPAAIVSHCVWLYLRFPLSYRDVEEMMAEHGVVVSYETIRAWCEKFGRHYAKQIRARRGRLGDTWHLDEAFLKIGGRFQYLWRAVDQDGSVLDIPVQPKRDKRAAARFFRKLLKGEDYAPRVVVTDKLGSYTAPCAKLVCGATHIRDKGVNNRVENSHQPTRVRERRMRRFKSASHAQRFLSTFSVVHDLFSISRHALSAENVRLARALRFEAWRHIAGVAPSTC
jgi:putative transposase